MEESNRLQNKNNKNTKFPIRFYDPGRRCLMAVLWLFAVSVLSRGVLSVFYFRIPAFILYILPVGIYIFMQHRDLRTYLYRVPSSRRYICTNLLAYLVLFAVSQVVFFAATLLFGKEIGNNLHTWLFFPIKIFFLLGYSSRLFSELLTVGLTAVYALLFPHFPKQF